MTGNDFVLSAPIKGECAYCGAPARSTDHVLPRSRGGGDDKANIVPCCYRCNSSKSNRTPDEWLRDGLYGRRAGKRTAIEGGI